MEAQEIDATLDELENRLDRLRALYEQYFLGIEKIEPTVARKDVDRRFWLLRKTQIRNTARRFRLQVLTQRYNTFQQHWTRVCREIENGTYVRHLLKVKKAFGEEPKTWAARKRLGLLRKGAGEDQPVDDAAAAGGNTEEGSDLAGMLTGGDLDAEVLAATAAAFEHAERPRPAAAAPARFTLDDLGPLNLDFDDDDAEPALPPAPKAKAPSEPTTRMAGSVKVPTFPPPVPIGAAPGAPQKPPLPKAPPGARPPLPGRPPLLGAPKVPSGFDASGAPRAAATPPVEPFPLAPSAPDSAPPPRPAAGTVAFNGARPAARPPLPNAGPAAPRAPMPSASGEPALRPRMPSVAGEPAPRPRMPSVTGEPAPRPPMPSASGDAAPRPRMPSVAGEPAPRPRMPSVAGEPAPRPPMPSASGDAAPRPRMPSVAGAAAPAAPGDARPAAQAAAGGVRPAAQATSGVAASPATRPVAQPRPAVPPLADRERPAPAPPRVESAARGAAGRDLSDDRLKQLHHELVETKKKLNLQNNVSLDALSKSLRETEQKLRAEHKGRAVDFQVVVKDGKAVVKPIVKK